jgi:hypothetical protein
VAVPDPAAASSAGPALQEYQPDEPPAEDQVEVVHRPGPILAKQKRELMAECARLGIQSNLQEKLMWFEMLLDLEAGSLRTADAVDRDQADRLQELLQSFPTHAALEAWGAGQVGGEPMLLTDEPPEG